ncbi:MAG: hypothetical protein AAF388_15950, partial [Bacteroidota bacterium]
FQQAKEHLEKVGKIIERKTFQTVDFNYYKAMAYLGIKTKDLEQAKLFGKKMLEGQVSQENFLCIIPAFEIGAIIACKEGKWGSSASLFFGAEKLRIELNTPVFTYEKQDLMNLEKQLEERLSADVLASVKSKHLSLEELANMAEEIFLS